MCTTIIVECNRTRVAALRLENAQYPFTTRTKRFVATLTERQGTKSFGFSDHRSLGNPHSRYPAAGSMYAGLVDESCLQANVEPECSVP